MIKNRDGVFVSRNRDEVSEERRGKDFARWHLNYTEIDSDFDFQLNYVRYRRTWDASGQHMHMNSAEITWVLHGMQPNIINGEDYTVYGGQALVSPPELIHGAVQRGTEQKGDFYYLTINPDCLSSFLPPDPETLNAVHSLLSDSVSVRMFVNIRKLSAAAAELQNAYYDASRCRKGKIAGALLRLLVMTLDAEKIENGIAPYSDFILI